MKKSRDGKRDQHNLDCTTRKLCFDPIFIDFHHYLNYLSFHVFFAATMRSWDSCSVPTDPSAPQHFLASENGGLISVKTGHHRDWVKTRVAMSSPCGKLYNDPLELQNPKWIQMVK